MKKFKYIIFAIIGLLFITASCSDGEERDRILNTELDAVTLNHQAQAKTVEIEVDKGETFVALWNGGEWGKVEVKGTTVEITVTDNTTLTKRSGSVEVRLKNGWRTKLIEVTQNGDNPVLNVIPDNIAFDFMGGERTIEVDSDIKWSAEVTNVDWLEIKSYVNASNIVLAVGQNPFTNTRQTSVTITAGGNSKDVMVEQTEALGSILPYLDFNNSSLENMIAFEEARYSSFIQGQASMVTTHKAFSKSALCSLVQYAMLGANYLTGGVFYDIVKYPEFFTEKQYDKFLTDNGFEYIYSSKGNDIYWLDYGEGMKHHCLTTVNPKLGVITYARSETKPVPVDSPTFASFPYMSEAVAFGSGKDVAKAWEAANKGTIKDESEIYILFIVEDDPEIHARLYSYLNKDKTLFRVDYVFHDKSKIYVPIGVGGITMNQRFEAMIKAEGFAQYGTSEGFPVYEHKTKGIEMSPSWGTLAGDPKEYGLITFVKPTSRSGVSQERSLGKTTTILTPGKTTELDETIFFRE